MQTKTLYEVFCNYLTFRYHTQLL